MASSALLTDDILIEIFAFLPLNSIYKLRCLSKVWLSNLSHPNFIVKWFHINNKSIPWIHYHTILCYNSDENPLKSEMAYPDFHSEFMYEHLFSCKFLMNQKPFQGAKLSLLGASNGLVLCMVNFYPRMENVSYHVCNPLTQKRVSLPSPPSAMSFYVSGIFCEYSSSFASSFKVVLIPQFKEPSKNFNVHVFCSDLGEWETFQVTCDDNVLWDWSNFSVVVIRGVFFWIEGSFRMLVYNLNQENKSDGHRCSLINLPDDEDFFDSILGESEGRVCYARTRIEGAEMNLSVWVLDEANWKILHKDISVDNGILAKMLRWIGGVGSIQVLGFSPVDFNVILLGYRHQVWGFNIQTRSLEELCVDNKHVCNEDSRCVPFVLTPMPTVLPPALLDRHQK